MGSDVEAAPGKSNVDSDAKTNAEFDIVADMTNAAADAVVDLKADRRRVWRRVITMQLASSRSHPAADILKTVSMIFMNREVQREPKASVFFKIQMSERN